MINLSEAKIKKAEMPLSSYITKITSRVHKYLSAFNDIIWDYKNAGLLQVFNAGFIDLDKQYLTLGVNGFVEGAEYLKSIKSSEYKDIDISSFNQSYKQYAKDILETIKDLNKQDRTKHCKFNTEFVPAESLGVKNLKWDREDGYVVPDRNCYNSYFYIVEDQNCSPLEKMRLMGKDFIGCLDGGSALHMNLDEHLTKEQYRDLMTVAVNDGCSYLTFNVPNTICNVCGHISKHHLDHCVKCGSHDVDYITRIIGYLKRVSNFSEARQLEAEKRYYAKVEKDEVLR